jgi:hypothetical protein
MASFPRTESTTGTIDLPTKLGNNSTPLLNSSVLDFLINTYRNSFPRAARLTERSLSFNARASLLLKNSKKGQQQICLISQIQAFSHGINKPYLVYFGQEELK